MMPLVEKRNASKYAHLMVKKTLVSSRLIRPQHEQLIPAFDKSELVLGKLLGSGAFSDIYELKGIEFKEEDCGCDTDSQSLTTEQEKARMQLAGHVAARDCQYVVKFLKSNVRVDAASDLLLEQKYLGTLTVRYPHENIIKLHGISTSNTLNAPEDMFLILERVEETLSERMETWRQEQYLNDCFIKRLDAALQLSSAMAHLHRLGIIYRDLKPNNIGFTTAGVLKLFDFGLCKELNSSSKLGQYCMSGITGSFKYLAPEVLKLKPYTLSADVYSFSMVLWQLLSLRPLFEGYSKRQYVKHVVINDERLELPNEWSSLLKCLIEKSWAREPGKRPTMKYIHGMLRQEMEEMTNVSSNNEMEI